MKHIVSDKIKEELSDLNQLKSPRKICASDRENLVFV